MVNPTTTGDSDKAEVSSAVAANSDCVVLWGWAEHPRPRPFTACCCWWDRRSGGLVTASEWRLEWWPPPPVTVTVSSLSSPCLSSPAPAHSRRSLPSPCPPWRWRRSLPSQPPRASWWDPPVLPGPQPRDNRQAHTFILMCHDISHNGHLLSDCWLDCNSDIYLGGRGGKFAGPSIRRIMTDPLLSNLKRLLPDSGARLPSPHPRQREEGQHDVQSAQLGGLPWRLVQVNKYWDCNIRSYLICNLGGIRELCGEHQDSTVRLSISCSLLLKPKQTSEPAQYKDPSQEDWRKLVCYCTQKPWLYNHLSPNTRTCPGCIQC